MRFANDSSLSLACCRMCPRQCRTDRTAGETGFCGAGAIPTVARIMLHRWEEPCISGRDPDRGSGAVFFCHCSLGCIYCQNRTISGAVPGNGRAMTEAALADAFLRLQEAGAYNINLVTPTHYTAQIADALEKARAMGLILPVVWNTGGYESADTIRSLAGLVDVYLTDFKYADPTLAKQLSRAEDYPVRAAQALDVMFRTAGPVRLDGEGMLTGGVIVRHLVLPGFRKDSIAVLRQIAETVPPDRIRLSLMRQYTPAFLAESCPPDRPGTEEIPRSLYRRVTSFEYQSVLEEAVRLGFEGYTQEGDSAVKKFTPDFTGDWAIPTAPPAF